MQFPQVHVLLSVCSLAAMLTLVGPAVNLHPQRTFYSHIVGCQPATPHHLPFRESWVQKAEDDAAARRIVGAYLHRPAEELYDLTCDPHEKHNLAGDPTQAGLLESTRGQLTKWRRQQGDPELSAS